MYFAIDKFPGTAGSRGSTRVRSKPARACAQDDYTKENAQDFALWKAAKPEDEATGAAWDSPWGRGRPGWHLECSAMAMELLGETLDLHCGRHRPVFPHHEDEIAQSEAATGKTFARCWCHGAFLLTDGAKMAKRVGNVSTVQGLREAGVSAAALRHFVFTTHYRKELNLSGEALEASLKAVRRVGDFARRLEIGDAAGTPELAAAADEAVAAGRTRRCSTTSTRPEALAALFNFIRRANAELDRRGRRPGGAGACSRGVRPDQRRAGHGARASGTGPVELAAWVEERIGARRAARARRDFAEADRIRAELTGRGVMIEDTRRGDEVEAHVSAVSWRRTFA